MQIRLRFAALNKVRIRLSQQTLLTSGGEKTALEGVPVIRKMIDAAGRQITILVAGKVTYYNLNQIKELTKSNELIIFKQPLNTHYCKFPVICYENL